MGVLELIKKLISFISKIKLCSLHAIAMKKETVYAV